MLVRRMNAATMQIGDIIASRFELREALGGGGLGRVFRAFDDKELREVAVKVLDPARCPADALRRYETLLASAARVKHPAIASQRFLAPAGGPPLVVGELLGGEDLDALRGRLGPLPWQSACEIVAVCAEALAALSTATGAAHRALKPGNIRVREDGEVRVLDFGIAELGVQAAAPRGPVYVEYRAPEQLEGAAGDARSDVFALGVLLFEMVTGVHPFSGPSTFKVMHRVLLQAAPRPSELDPPRSVPATVEALLVRALARRPADRLADAAELGRVLSLLRRGSAAEPAPAVARRPVLAVDDGPDSTVTAVDDDPSTMLRRFVPPAANPPANPPAPAVVAAAAPAMVKVQPAPASAPMFAAPASAPMFAAPKAAPRFVVARSPVVIADSPLIDAVDATEVVPISESRRASAAVPAAMSEEPSTLVVRMREASVGERTEVLPPIPADSGDSQEMTETTAAVGASMVGTLLLAVPTERTTQEVTTLRVSGSPRSEMPTMALPGELPARQPRKSRSLTSLVVLNIVLVALAEAGVAWAMLS